MSEILTESFCERCGTRYTFESATPRGARLKGIKTLSRGLKNFVMSDDTSIDEAMAAARSESDREVTVHQLDAFHETFNFCMSCRQYTCGNCWNEAENQCLSCSPHLGHEILPAPFPNIDANMGLPTAAAGNGANGHGAVSPSGYTDLPTFDTSAWPTADLVTEQPPAPGIEEPPAQVAEPTGETPLPADFLIGDDMPLPADFPIDETAPSAAAEPVEAAAEAVVAEAVVAEAVVAEAVVAEAAAVVPALTPEPAPAPGATLGEEAAEETDLRAAAAAAQTAAMLQRFRPGQSLDEALAEYESEHEPAEAAAEVASVLAEEPVIAEEAPETVEAEAEAAPDVQITTEPAAEPVAAEAEVEAPVAEELVAAEPEPEPVVVAEAGTEAEAAPDVQIAAEPAAEPVVAEAEVESPDAEELVAAEPEPEPVVAAEAETPVAVEPEPIASQPRRDDKVEQPTWRIVAPEEPPAVAPVVTPPPAPAAPTEAPATPPAAIQAQEPVAPVAPEPAATPAEPQWPTQPQWPAQARTSEGLPFLGRPAAPTGGLEALWAESAREVTAAPAATTRAGVEPCVSCGLSLSATARFCRRCGTRQG